MPMDDVVSQMRKFMEPKSVAIMGLSRTPFTIGKTALDILAELRACGYQGKIYPVHPQATELQGIKTYASVADAPADIDLAIINLPRELVPGIVKECIDKGIEAIAILTQGFTDANDEKGDQLQKQIDDIIRGSKARILGPNSIGTANAYANISLGFLKTQMEEVPVSWITQSGLFFLGPLGLKPFGKGIDLGNACDIHFADALEYFEQDDETKVIALHIEGMRDTKKFLRTVARVAHKKPVVAFKTGRSEQASHAVLSHTGSLTGRDELWDVAFRQAGVIRVNDIEELIDTVRAFYILPLMKGKRVGIVSWSGGANIMAIDACQSSGLEIAKVSQSTIDRLRTLYPSWQDVRNPADIWPAVMIAKKASLFEVEKIVLETLLDDAGVDAVLCMLGAFISGLEVEFTKIVTQAAESHPGKPFVFHPYAGGFYSEFKDELEKTNKTMVFSSPQRALRALKHLSDYAKLSAYPDT